MRKGELIEFGDSFIRDGYLSTEYEELNQIDRGAYGIVYKTKQKKQYGYYALKKIDFKTGNEEEVLREYLNYLVVNKIANRCNDYLVEHFDAWFERDNTFPNPKEAKLSLYIEMQLCDQTLESVIDFMSRDEYMLKDEILTPLGYFIMCELFIEVLEGVEFLHKQNPPIIHRDLKPTNILLYRFLYCDRFVKIGDFGLIALHALADQSHSLDKGTTKFMAPETINCVNYNTKADIYSLGVTFQRMFDPEFNG
jgi:serine/threonine protein kinase